MDSGPLVSQNTKSYISIEVPAIYLMWTGSLTINALRGNDQEPIQLNSTFYLKYQSRKEFKHQGWHDVYRNTIGKPKESSFPGRWPLNHDSLPLFMGCFRYFHNFAVVKKNLKKCKPPDFKGHLCVRRVFSLITKKI